MGRPPQRIARRARALLPLAVASLVLSGCWLQPGWGPGRSGHNPFESGLIRENVARLAEAWSVTAGAYPRDPVVTRHGVHVADRGFNTYDLRTGALLQVVPVNTDTGTPVVRNDHIYLPVRSLFGNSLLEYDLSSGEQTGEFGGGGGLSTSVDGDTFAGVSYEGGDPPIPSVGVVDVVDGTGWGASPEPYVGLRQPTWAGDRVILSYDRSVAAMARRPVESCEPGQSRFLCQMLWSTSLPSFTTQAAVSDDGDTAYVGDVVGFVTALATEDGSVRWQAQLGGDEAPGILATPTVGDGQLFVPSDDGRLYVFAADGCGAATCEPEWVAATGALVRNQAALAGGVLYVASDDGSISAFDAAGCGSVICLPLWRTETGSPIEGGPVVAFGHLLVVTEDGRLIAYRPTR